MSIFFGLDLPFQVISIALSCAFFWIFYILVPIGHLNSEALTVVGILCNPKLFVRSI